MALMVESVSPMARTATAPPACSTAPSRTMAWASMSSTLTPMAAPTLMLEDWPVCPSPALLELFGLLLASVASCEPWLALLLALVWLESTLCARESPEVLPLP